MFENTKCECGHQNYTGTILCESCGKPLEDDGSLEPLEMRYDGVARRSQRPNKTWLDHIWSFFSSVKVAVYIIIITLCLAMLGTIYPQESVFINLDPATYYEEEYGLSGKIYYMLGLSHTYESWWFRGLLVMIGASLVICSLDRVLPLYRALSKQRIPKHTSFIKRQKVVFVDQLSAHMQDDEASKQAWLEQFDTKLRKKFYRVHRDETALLAEKNRFSRWGPYINHIGLIIFLLAILMRFIPGWHMDQYLSIREGEIKQIPGTHFYIKNEEFILDFYKPDELSAHFREEGRTLTKHYETKAVLYECVADCDIPGVEPQLVEVMRHDIIVNKPLNYKGLLAYQIDYDFVGHINSVEPTLSHKESGEVYGKLFLDLTDPEEYYQAGPYDIRLVDYYTHYGYNEERLPTKMSARQEAPAFIFHITGPDLPDDGTIHIYFPKETDKVTFEQDLINELAGSPFVLKTESMDDVDVALYSSLLNLRVDRAMPFIWVGAAICVIGLAMGFYWHHRRVWLKLEGGDILLGAHTNKNWYGLRKEIADVLSQMGITVDPKSLENGVKK